ncbi:MAG TPA: DUF1878 family protein [Chondromyces sp.]|nr:DUF1878 family protein [Chondromyces sp.]
MENELLKRIERLEYHQQLLLRMANKEKHEFDWMIVKHMLGKEEVEEFYKLCEELSKKCKEQKAEGFVFHAPLYYEFIERLHPKLNVKEIIQACLAQGMFVPLMRELKRNLE